MPQSQSTLFFTFSFVLSPSLSSRLDQPFPVSQCATQMSFWLVPLFRSLKSIKGQSSIVVYFLFCTLVFWHSWFFLLCCFHVAYCVLQYCQMTSLSHLLLTRQGLEASALCVNKSPPDGTLSSESSCFPSRDFVMSRSSLICQSTSGLFPCSLRLF